MNFYIAVILLVFVPLIYLTEGDWILNAEGPQGPFFRPDSDMYGKVGSSNEGEDNLFACKLSNEKDFVSWIAFHNMNIYIYIFVSIPSNYEDTSYGYDDFNYVDHYYYYERTNYCIPFYNTNPFDNSYDIGNYNNPYY